MLPYSRIAFSLEGISKAARNEKADLVSNLLSQLPDELLCTSVRLLMGELWPSWELREMGIGPETIIAALEEVSMQDVRLFRRELDEIGAVAEVALQQKSQKLLSLDSLEAPSVYERLRHISKQSGPNSDFRKGTILKGLFLEASPLEGKYIARTVIRNMLSGLGPQTMTEAISIALDCDYEDVKKGYSLMPELGMLALAASRGELTKIRIQPARPIKPMLFLPGEPIVPGAYLPRYPGMRVQFHMVHGDFFIFTARLKNITSALMSLHRDLPEIKHELIAEADLVGFQDGKMLSLIDLVRYINRRHLSRKSCVDPAIIASDLLYLDGESLIGLSYAERRRRMVSILGEPKGIPFRGFSPAEEKVLDDLEDVKKYYRQSLNKGLKGLTERDLSAAYYPGRYSSTDHLLREAEETIIAVIVRADFGKGKKTDLLTRFGIALRSGKDFVPVGTVSSGLREKETKALTEHLMSRPLIQSEEGIKVLPQVVLAVNISGARYSEKGYSLSRPRVKEIRLDSPLEEVDSLEKLEEICHQ